MVRVMVPPLATVVARVNARTGATVEPTPLEAMVIVEKVTTHACDVVTQARASSTVTRKDFERFIVSQPYMNV